MNCCPWQKNGSRFNRVASSGGAARREARLIYGVQHSLGKKPSKAPCSTVQVTLQYQRVYITASPTSHHASNPWIQV